MADPRTRIVTPYTDPDRFTAEEKAAFDAGRCCEDIGQGLDAARQSVPSTVQAGRTVRVLPQA